MLNPDSDSMLETGESAESMRISPVLKLRLAVCVLVALAAAVVKLIGGDVYKEVKEKYGELVGASIVMTDKSGGIEEHSRFIGEMLSGEGE